MRFEKEGRKDTIVNVGESFVGLFVAGVLIRMVLQGELPVSPLDLLVGGSLGHLQYIIIALPCGRNEGGDSEGEEEEEHK